MCARYEPVLDGERFRQSFRAQLPLLAQDPDVRPGGTSAFVRLRAGQREALGGTFGLMPHWAKPDLFRYTYNARSETVATKPSFRSAWRHAQHCIVPVEAIWEPDWRSGHHIATRITRADGLPMGIAGLWEERKIEQTGEILFSFTMLTINADRHAIMENMHKADKEKRMAVILREEQWDVWLSAKPTESPAFLTQYPAELMTMEAGSQPAEIKKVIELAREVLGSQAAADTWMQTPSIGLNGDLPGRVLNQAAGLERVRALLQRIQHTLF